MFSVRLSLALDMNVFCALIILQLFSNVAMGDWVEILGLAKKISPVEKMVV
jgi:hypothetical protein